MKKLIYSLSISLVILFVAACDKKGDVNISGKFENPAHARFVNEAKIAMQKILPSDDFLGLKWDASTIKTPAGGEGTELTVFDESGENKLIFCEIGKMKMYQWNGEVHLVFAQAIK